MCASAGLDLPGADRGDCAACLAGPGGECWGCAVSGEMAAMGARLGSHAAGHAPAHAANQSVLLAGGAGPVERCFRVGLHGFWRAAMGLGPLAAPGRVE